ncbi:ABC transporter permease [Brenneria roseae subsp. americana]|uniref:ABC transporter permease n=1 Tax=Brenneria roseae subsp. americana TaxID=1508507 RepID=A0A2U1TNW3_9GAMM|nr:ABC transporter permease subunit [Brenneria roseae]PWC11100.1 ABC transporter permease [Brenneria roseae subsp. americana]
MVDYLNYLSFGSEGWAKPILSGALLTIELALATLPFGLVAGLLLANGMNSQKLWLQKLCVIYGTIFRALPELLTIFIIYYGSQLAIKSFSDTMGWETPQINGFIAGLIALGVVFSAFSCEIFYTALRTIPKGQYEAAYALGLSTKSSYFRVTLPQIWRIALPGLGNVWLVLLKDTSLVSVIALSDLMRQTYVAVNSTKEPFFFYALACAIYLVFSAVSGVILSFLERRTNRFYVRG